MKRLALLVALGLAAATTSGCHKSEAAVEPNTGAQIPPGEVWLTDAQVQEAQIVYGPIAEQDVDDTILTSGRVTFDDLRVSHVYSPVTGRVVKIDAELGAHVKKGQPLAVIESPDIGSAVSDVAKADADVIASEHDYKRKKDLYDQHAASQADVEASEDSYRKAKAELERARQKALLLRAGSYDSVSQTYTLTSQIDGEVVMRAVNPGIEVTGQYSGGNAVELFTVGELTGVWVLADIYEMDIPRVKIGSKVEVRIVSYPDKVFVGKVELVTGVLDPTTRTARVRCSFPNLDGLLKPEMYATVQISVENRKALAIPRSSLLRLGESTIVFVNVGKAPDGRERFMRMPVGVDEGEGSNWLVVQHGLEVGQKVVTNGAILLAATL
jgi:cobalt-zinc-cadmium efflux system membrane fusion protein